jgi:hypothetical protein
MKGQHNKEKRGSLANIKAMFDSSKKQDEKQKKSPVGQQAFHFFLMTTTKFSFEI